MRPAERPGLCGPRGRPRLPAAPPGREAARALCAMQVPGRWRTQVPGRARRGVRRSAATQKSGCGCPCARDRPRRCTAVRSGGAGRGADGADRPTDRPTDLRPGSSRVSLALSGVGRQHPAGLLRGAGSPRARPRPAPARTVLPSDRGWGPLPAPPPHPIFILIPWQPSRPRADGELRCRGAPAAWRSGRRCRDRRCRDRRREAPAPGVPHARLSPPSPGRRRHRLPPGEGEPAAIPRARLRLLWAPPGPGCGSARLPRDAASSEPGPAAQPRRAGTAAPVTRDRPCGTRIGPALWGRAGG